VDVYRPAAIKQLEVLGQQIGVDVYSEEGNKDVVGIATRAIEKAKEINATYMIVDTAGRLHIDETLMEELKELKKAIKPQEILLVVDAMIGQDAVNLAKSFNDASRPSAVSFCIWSPSISLTYSFTFFLLTFTSTELPSCVFSDFNASVVVTVGFPVTSVSDVITFTFSPFAVTYCASPSFSALIAIVEFPNSAFPFTLILESKSLSIFELSVAT